MKIICLSAASCLTTFLVAAFASAQPVPEVRATWLTTTANDAIATPQKTTETMRRLRAIGLNTVYVECWKNGYTEFPSDVMKRAIGVSMKVNGALQRDLVQETLVAAHRNQLLYVAWFEYGFMAAHKDTHNELRARRDWLVLDRQGNDVAKNGFVWMNPLHPDAQALLIGIVKEAIARYDLDGIQLDDRIVWPSLEMGYDDFTKKLYASEHDGREPPADFRDREWCEWRQRKVQAFAQRFVSEIRKANPDLLISLSPGPHPWALENYLIDWPAWARWDVRGGRAWDEFVPQVYRMNHEAFAKDWPAQVEATGDRIGDLVAGIRLVGDGPDLPVGDATKCVQLTRKTKAAGHAWWFSRGVLDTHVSEITKLYDVGHLGHAAHRHRPADWRAAPIVMTKVATHPSAWEANVPRGAYRIIAKRNGAWEAHEPDHRFGMGGNVEVDVPGAEAVELLVDRRGD